MPVPDHRGFAAKRQSGGSGGRIRRNGLADGLRTARVGDLAFQGDHDIGGALHDHLAIAFHSGHPKRGLGYLRARDISQDERAEKGSSPDPDSRPAVARRGGDGAAPDADWRSTDTRSGAAYAGEEVAP